VTFELEEDAKKALLIGKITDHEGVTLLIEKCISNSSKKSRASSRLNHFDIQNGMTVSLPFTVKNKEQTFSQLFEDINFSKKVNSGKLESSYYEGFPQVHNPYNT